MVRKFMKNKNLLLIFTRNPELGKVKSRLAVAIGEVKALNVYKALLNHTKNITIDLPVTKQVCYSESIPKEDIWTADIYEKKLQHGTDLGEKMHNAFKDGFSKGYEKIVVIGSDCDTLSSELISQAFESLVTRDVVLGPAEDGGYYLLGMKKNISAIFKNKAWGTATVLQDTLDDLKGHSLKELIILNDIDVISDIKSDSYLNKFL